MKQLAKRCLALLMVLVMCFGLIPVLGGHAHAATENSEAAKYYIAAKRTKGNSFYYMTGNLVGTSTKRYQAVDSGLTQLPDSITEPEDGYVFVFEKQNDGTYKIYVDGMADQYLGWSSGNSGALLAENKAKALTLIDNEDGSVQLTIDSGTRNLSLNNSSGNDYFAFYAGTQVNNLYLIPVVEGGNESGGETPCDHDYEAKETDPTCTSKGYTTYTCKNDGCDDSYVADEVAALGHNVEGNACTRCDRIAASLVTDISSLNCGNQIIIVASGSYKALSTEQKTSNRGAANITKDGNTVVVEDDVQVITLEAGAVAGTFAFNTGSGYLYAASSGDNLLKTMATLNANGSWDIKIANNGVATIKAQGTNTRNLLRYNNGNSKLFSCYVSGQEDISIYILPGSASPAKHHYNADVTDPTCTEGGYTTYTCSTCGDTYKGDEVEAKGHDHKAVVTDPTCTADGYTTYTCACGDTYTDDKVDAKGHTNGDPVAENVVAPTCTVDGSHEEVVYCTVCPAEVSREKVTDKATGHNYVAGTTVAPTCTAEGYTPYTCACGDSYNGDKVDAKGHDYDIVVTAPTCTAEGYTTYTCTACGNSYKGDEVDAKGHANGDPVAENVVAPTCTEDGSHEEVVYCTVCPAEVSREKVTDKATGHNYVAGTTVAPTCTAEGYTPYTCACGDSYNGDKVDAKGHDWVTATCIAPKTCSVCKTTEGGLADHHFGEDDICVFCGKTEQEVCVHSWKDATCTEPKICILCDLTVGEAKGHDKTSFVVTAPTCTEDGYTTYTCSCGHVYTADEVAALGHKYETDVTAPTCTAEGYTTYTCTACGNSYKGDEVDAKGHDYDTIVTAPTCTAEGYTTYTCTACGDSYKGDEVDANGHDYDTDVTDPTCTEAGYTTYTCSTCGDTYKGDEVEAKGHDHKAVVTDPTCTADGYTTYTCACGDTYTGNIVATPGHAWAEATCTTLKTCSTCGATEGELADHNYVDGVCTGCGAEELSTVTASVSIASYANANGWTNESKYYIVNVDGVVTVTATPSNGQHNGKYYSSNDSWRIYQTESGKIEVAASGKTIVSVKITYAAADGGIFLYNGAEAKSNAVIEVNGTSAAFNVSSKSTTKGKVQITAIEVVYLSKLCKHTNTTKLEAVAPTCTESGLTEGAKCDDCGETVKAQEVVPATGHNYNEVVTAPTCTVDGYTTYTCSVCGDTYTGNVVKAPGHIYENGKCTGCGVEKCNHTNKEVVSGKAASCTESGLTEGEKCTDCNETLKAQEVIPALGHNWVSGECTICHQVKLTYVTSQQGYIYNWGTREVEATFLSPNAEAFYAGQNTYEYFSELAGGTGTSDAYKSDLYKALQTLMSGKQTYQTSYDATRDLYQYTDCENSGDPKSISAFYSGSPVGPAWDGGSTWNREHVWPNSKGDASGNGENDIMMLRPAVSSNNSSRGNKAYGESGGFYHPNSESNGALDLRGDVSRIVLYVYVRWGNTERMWGSDGVIENLDILLKWMEEDPVDTWELGRNDSVESITGTRNVFVDYPELAFLLFGEDIPEDMTTPSGEAQKTDTCNHNYVAGDTVAPTCTSKGYTLYTCSICQKTTKKDYVDMLDHNYVDGKCTVCQAVEVIVPVYVTEVAAGTAYKLGLHSTSKNATYYFVGTMSGYYGATQTDYSQGVDVYLETASGGYYLYFMNASGAKQYINLVASGTYLNFKFDASASSVYTWDADRDALYTTVGSEVCYIGTYGDYVTMGVLKGSKLSDSDYIARLYTIGGNSGETPEPPVACEHTNTEVIPGKAATCTETGLTEGKKCSDCGTVLVAQTEIPATGHNYVDGTCTGCGKAEPVAGEETTVTVSIADYAAANSWANGTRYSELKMNDVVTVTVSGTNEKYDVNTGKYYDNGLNWRIYQNENPAIVVSAADTTIISVKITYTPYNTGVLTLNGVNVESDAVVEVNASSVTFSVGNTGDATNGQVRITAIEVVYAGGSGETPEPPVACEHTNTEVIPGKAATCTETGLTEGKRCSDCGTVLVAQTTILATGHSYVDGTCTGCGKAEPVAGEETTVTVSIADYAAANSWANGTRYSELKMNDVVTVTVSGTNEKYDVNTGKYYDNGNNWRIYQNENPAIVVSAVDTTIISVKITYTPYNTGVLTLNGVNVESDAVVEVNASSVTFSVGNTGGATNGQVRITAIEVVYAGGSGETPEPPVVCEHTNTETIPGKAATCTESGLTDGKKCSDCGTVLVAQTEIPATGHSYVDGTCTGCGETEPAAGEETTVIVSIAGYAAANSWVNGTRYSELKMNDVVTVTVSGTNEKYDVNTGKYYDNGNNWRIYQNENPAIVVSAADTTIISVKITYTPYNTGVLTLNGVNVESDAVVEVNASSVTFSVGNTGGATNGQVRITAIEVVYAGGSGETPEPPVVCEHTNTEVIPGKAATCTETGLTEGKKCSDCGTVLVAQTEIPVIDHTYVADTPVAPTCTAEGYTTYTCSVCGHSYNGDKVAATGHNYVASATVAPTCTTEGYTTYTCTACDDSYKGDKVPAIEHNYVDGKCTECGADEHNWIAATCTTPKTCADCGQTEGEALGHSFALHSYTNATCVSSGVTTYACSGCGAMYSTVVNATGHKMVDGICATCGAGVTTTDETVTVVITDKVEIDEVVVLPIPEVTVSPAESATTIVIDLSNGKADAAVKVEIPVAEVTETSVVVIVHADGTEEIVQKTVLTENGLVFEVEENVTVKVIDNTKEFVDVDPEGWSSKAIDFASSREILNGMGNDVFSPKTNMTRGQLAVMLYNLESKPEVDLNSTFTDANGTWYTEAVEWAAAEKIVMGNTDGTFGGEKDMTREQMVTFLYRYAGSPKVTSSAKFNTFNDCASVSDWAVDAMCWAIEMGIINGVGNNTIDPSGTATREQVAQILMNFLNAQ